MLKDITLGQFFPGDSPIHRLDPRTKLIGTLVFIVTLFLVKGIWGYVLMAAFWALCVKLARLNFKNVLRGLRPVLYIMIFTGILNLFWIDGPPIFTLGPLKMTWEGLWQGIQMVMRVMLLILGSCLMTYTTSPIRITDAIESLLSPLKKLGVPVHDFAMMISIALRFIPALIEETDKIMSAQRARGAAFDGGSLIQRAKALLPLMVPLFVSAFRRSQDLAVAMESRCYHGGEGKGKLHPLHYTKLDAVAFPVLVLLVCCVILLRLV